MNILIVDDDKIMLKQLEKDIFVFFSAFIDRVNIYSYSSNFQAIKMDIEYNFCFMDIDLVNDDGINLVKSIKNIQYKSKIVFISNHLHLIHDSLIVQPFYFIRKPYYKNDLNNFFAICTDLETSKKVILINYKYNKSKINIEDIIYIMSYGHQLTIKVKEDFFYDNRTMKDMECYLKDVGFFARVHKSYIINLNYLRSYKKNLIILSDGTEIILGRIYKKEFDKIFQEYLLQ